MPRKHRQHGFADDDQTLADVLASDEAAFETSAATSTAAYQIADAQAVHDKIMADAQAANVQSLADANSITALVAKNAYFATLPDVYPAFDWSTTPNPALLADYSDLFSVDDLEISDGSSVSSPAPSPESPAPVYGQSWTVGVTKYDFVDLAGTANGMQPLLNDNGPYDPPNPWPASDFMTGISAPGGAASVGGGGLSGSPNLMPVSGPGSPPSGGGPAAPPGPASAPMPDTNPEAAQLTEEQNWETDSEFDARFLDQMEQSWANPLRTPASVDDLPKIEMPGRASPAPASNAPDEVQTQLAARRAQIEIELGDKRILNWLIHGGEAGDGSPPMVTGPDGQTFTPIFWIGDQAYSWRQGESGRWAVVALVRPEDVTPEDWKASGTRLFAAADFREITDSAERGRVNQALGEITQERAMEWMTEHLPDSLMKEIQQTGAIVGILSGNGERLLEAEKMAKAGVPDAEIAQYLAKGVATDAAVDVATAGAAKFLGPVIGAVLHSEAAKKLLKKGGEAGKKFVDRLTNLSKSIADGGTRRLSPAEEKNIREGLEELRKIAGEADEVVGKEMNGMVAELEKAAGGTAESIASMKRRRPAIPEGMQNP